MVIRVAHEIERKPQASQYEQEDIPDGDRLYMRAHKSFFFPNYDLRPGVFQDHGDAMSTDWDKYSTPEETRARATVPMANAVIELSVGGIRMIPGQEAIHTPETGNQAHTDVVGDKKKDPEVRVQFRRLAILCLPLPDDPLPVPRPAALGERAS